MSKKKRIQVLNMIKLSGMLRPRDVEAVGISGEYLNKLFVEDVLERPSRGIYTMKGAKVSQHQTLLEACKRIPRGTVCLLSALQFHELTTQMPFEVWLAIDVKAHRPQGDLPPVRICRFSKQALTFGVKEHKIDRASIKVYTPAKTVADCFKYRNKIGLDVALESLRAAWSSRKATMDELHEAARVCRVANVMQPYLESLV